MTHIEHMSDYPPGSGRSLYLLECEMFSDIAPQLRHLPGTHFVAFLIADFTKLSREDLGVLSKQMIDAGCRYFCAAGNGCEVAHDVFDWACCEFDPDSENVIITTDHSRDSFAEAIWYVLNCADPDGPYAEDWQAVVAIRINGELNGEALREAFSNPVDFSEHNGPEVDDDEL